MFDTLFPGAILLIGLATALVAGVFLSFSDFVMRALGSTEAVSGIEAMQGINREVFRSLFMVLFLGLAPISVGLALVAMVATDGPAQTSLLAGAAIYLVGVFAVTVLRNVPMNERLKGSHHRSAAAYFYWATYLRDWTRWNHVRWLAAATAALCYLAAVTVLA